MNNHERAERLMADAEKLGCETPTESMIAEAIHDAEEEARNAMMFQLNLLGMDDARRALARWREHERTAEYAE